MAETLTPQQQADIAAAQQTNQQQADAPRDLRELIDASDAPIMPKPDQEPDPEKPAKKKLTQEEIAQTTDLMGQRLGFKEKKKDEKDDKTKDKSDDKSGIRADDGTSGKDDLEGKKDEKKKVKVTKREPAPDHSDIAAITAAKTARAVAEELRSQASPKQEDRDPFAAVESTLLPDEKADLSVYKQMASDNQAYKDLPRQYLASIQKIEAYKTKWEQDNPGEEFNPDDEAHDAFYSNATPQFNARDFRTAEVRLEADKVIKQREEADRPKKVAEMAEKAQGELAPTIQQTKINAAVKVINTLGEDFLPMIEKEGFEKFEEANPETADALKMAAARMDPFLTAAHQFDDPKGRIPYNQNDPGHREYVQYLFDKENMIAKQSIKHRTDDEGRLFLPRHEYLQIPPAKRGDYWYLDADKLIAMRVEEEAKMAKEFVSNEQKKLEKMAKARGWTTNGETSKSRAPKKEKVEEPDPDTDKIQSPEAGGGGKLDTATGSEQQSANKFWDLTSDILFRR